MQNRFRSSFRQYDKEISKKQTDFSGELGANINGEKRVEVENRPGFVYVRLRNNINEIIQAYNDVVSAVYGLPVIVVRDGTRYRIKGRDVARYNNWGTSSPFLPIHGNAHSFNPEAGGGGDVVYVYGRQIMPLLLSPSGTNGGPNLLTMENYAYHKPDGSWTIFGISGTPNILQHKPTNDQAFLILLLGDTNTGNITYLVNSGTPFSANITGSYNVLKYLPNYTNNDLLPLMAVRLTSGTKSIEWGNIYDVRQFYTPFGGGGATIHNDLTGIQGGAPGEYYHLSLAERNAAISGTFPGWRIPDGDYLQVGNRSLPETSAFIMIGNQGVLYQKASGSLAISPIIYYGELVNDVPNILEKYNGFVSGWDQAAQGWVTLLGDIDHYDNGKHVRIDASGTYIGHDLKVSGTATFYNFPFTPSSNPTMDYHVANKKYVDDTTAGSGSGGGIKLSSIWVAG